MIKVLSFFVLLGICMSLTSYSQSMNWQWAKSAGGVLDDNSTDIASDKLGNIYVTGYFQSPVIVFDTVTLINPYSPSEHIFVVKYNSSGMVQWAKAFGSVGWDAAQSIAIDLMGNIYITGAFWGDSITFGGTTLYSIGGDDMFIVKLNSSGDVLWAKCALGNNGDVAGMSVTTDADGNALVTGYSRAFVTYFDTIVLNKLGMNTYLDGFVAKYSATGNVLWAKNFGASANEMPYGIAIDKHNNAYVTGYFDSPTWNYGNGTIYCYSSNPDFFILQYDSLANLKWVRRGGGLSYEKGFGITLDSNDNPVVTGYMDSQHSFFGTDTLFGITGFVFFASYDPSGSLTWATNEMGGRPGYGWAIAADTSDKIYTTGYYGISGMNFDSTYLNCSGGRDAFIGMLNTSGSGLWASHPLGTGDEEGKGIAIDQWGNIYTTGCFKSTTDTFGNSILTNSGNNDVYVAKILVTQQYVPLAATHTVTVPQCHGLSSGTAQIFVSGGTPPYTYNWSHGANTAAVFNLTAGSYFATVYDAGGNSLVDTISIAEPPEINTEIFLTSSMLCPGDSVVAVAQATGGSPPIALSWTTDHIDYLFSDTLIIAQPDTIFLIAADNNGCTQLMDTVVYPCNSTDGSELFYRTNGEYFSPNPFTHQLVVTTYNPEPETVVIYNFLGQQVLQNTFTKSTTINAEQLAKGIYFYALRNTDGALKIGKVVKQ